MRRKRPLTALARTRRGSLLVLGDDGLIVRSVDDGASWHRIELDTRADLEAVRVTRLGIFVVGDRGTLLASHDDGRSFEPVDSALAGHVWSLAEVGGDLLIGGEAGQVWRLARRELALVMRDAYAGRDPVIAELAGRIHEGDPDAELVLEDALQEREPVTGGS